MYWAVLGAVVGCAGTVGFFFMKGLETYTVKPTFFDSSASISPEAVNKNFVDWKHVYPIKSREATIYVDKSGAVRIPSAEVVEKMEFRDLEELYQRYVASIQTVCKRQIHAGNVLDGGYEVCQDEQYAPKMPCLVYSVGIRDDFTFDEDVHKLFGCEVHGFDPANGMKDHIHSTKVYFHSIGLGDKDEINKENWKVRTLKSIREELGHTTRNIDILKIDIEANEWKALPNILATGQLSGVKQLYLELHSVLNYQGWHSDRSLERYKHYLNLLRQIYDEGFRIFFFRRWAASVCMFTDEFKKHRTGCHEVHFVRV